MTVCEMRTAANKARNVYKASRDQFALVLETAKQKKQTLTRDTYKKAPSAPGDAAFVRAYCKLLSSILPKPLGAQTPGTSGSVSASESAAIARSKITRIGASNAVNTSSVQPMADMTRERMTEQATLVNSYYVEIHKKFALAVACLIFVILGAPIALRFPRGGVGLTIGVSLVVFALYYICLIGGEALAKRGLMPAFISMWLANILFGAVGIYLLSKMGTESSTARGGDLAEKFEMARDAFTRMRRRRARRVA
jgi:lipopolysaccharide export LptBFGC system permease protein LptF